MFNLIDNAIKYTSDGGQVTVRGRSVDREVHLVVADTGQGISQEALPHIFERFYRADPSRSKETQGVGLGLSLVKWIVGQHRGTIRVESQPNQGSRFSIVLPKD